MTDKVECACGCGEMREKFDAKGIRRRYIHGHHARIPVEDRFWDKVEIGYPWECWEWQAYTHLGYGRVRYRGESTNAHRVAWELTQGPIPGELHVLHRCDNRPCVNPTHLFLGTNYDNIRDRMQKDRPKPGVWGEKHPDAKLNRDDVVEIRRLVAKERMPIRDVADRFGVVPSTVRRVCRDGWTHVEKYLKESRDTLPNMARRFGRREADRIRQRARSGELQTDIASEMGVSLALINRVVNYRSSYARDRD